MVERESDGRKPEIWEWKVKRKRGEKSGEIEGKDITSTKKMRRKRGENTLKNGENTKRKCGEESTEKVSDLRGECEDKKGKSGEIEGNNIGNKKKRRRKYEESRKKAGEKNRRIFNFHVSPTPASAVSST